MIKTILISWILILYSGQIAAQLIERPEHTAVIAAVKWLDLLDQADYKTTWKNASTLFQKSVTADNWEKVAKPVREPFGNITKRIIKYTQYTTSLPGVPDGEYVVIQFKTEFENKKVAVETITPRKDDDGEWRVSGYYIK